MTGAKDTFAIAGRTFIANSRTDAAYLQETLRFWHWVQQRYTTLTLEDALTSATIERYWQWCAPQLSPATIQRRKVAIQWFVDIAMQRFAGS